MSDRFSACLNSFSDLSGFKEAILNAKSIGHSNAGTEYLGPLQRDLTSASPVRNVSKNQNEARALIAFMTSPEAAPLLCKTAMEPPRADQSSPSPRGTRARRPRGEASALNKARNIRSMS